MARKPRCAPGNIAYHVMNRTWANIQLFEDDADYQAFQRVLAQAIEREKTLRLCAYCLMPRKIKGVISHFQFTPLPLYSPTMARKPRFAPGNIAYHVMNRTWGNIQLLEDGPDCQAFQPVLAEAIEREESLRGESSLVRPRALAA